MGLDRFLLICPSGKNQHRNPGYGTPSPSLRGALATKQSSFGAGKQKLDCFVAWLLAMTMVSGCYIKLAYDKNPTVSPG